MASSGAVVERHGVVVTFLAPEEQRPVFDALLGDEGITYMAGAPEDERAETLRTARAVLAWNLRRELAPEQVRALEGIGLVQLLSAGADSVPFELVPDGVPIASNVGAYAEPMAEHTMAMALALAKRLPQKHAE